MLCSSGCGSGRLVRMVITTRTPVIGRRAPATCPATVKSLGRPSGLRPGRRRGHRPPRVGGPGVGMRRRHRDIVASAEREHRAARRSCSPRDGAATRACPVIPARRERWSGGGWQGGGRELWRSHCRGRQRSQTPIRAPRSRAWDCGTRPSLGISCRGWWSRRVKHGSACPAGDSWDCDVSRSPAGRHSVGEG